MTRPQTEDAGEPADFIREIVRRDLADGTHSRIVTRFPPEPNGYLHIGHAKSICLNFGLVSEAPGSRCHLRFDDTNPAKEDVEYVEAIKEDVRWLGFDWGEHLYHASDYFDQIYEWALELIRKGLAYVCHLTTEEVRATRGTVTEPGTNSPYRDRTVEENLELFERMRRGGFEEGECTLRAKIDMASPNMNMRDPVLYRIRKVPHDRTGDKWCIYPTYDMAHGYSDAIEGITHSICTLEFEVHRPLYDWLIDNVSVPHRPRQYEFARLNLTYTVMSKRKLLQLVEDGHVDGWDDPRMPTLSGMRRRGYTPEAIRRFCRMIGVTKFKSMTEVGLLEHAVRAHLNEVAPRFMGVLRPLKLVLTNWPEGHVEEVEAANNPGDPSAGTRVIRCTRELYIEQEDFAENPPPKFMRLAPGREVRLRYGWNVRCTDVVKDGSGAIVELRGTYDPDSRDLPPPKGSAVIHWVSVSESKQVEVRLYDRLFRVPDPEDGPEGGDFRDNLNPDSLQVIPDARVEPGVADLPPGSRFQFERLGYFCIDTRHSQPGRPVINRTVTLKDSWARIQARNAR